MSAADGLIAGFDRALRALAGVTAVDRASPADGVEGGQLTDDERRHAAGLMRVNHAGEVCAQALYDGQAATARSAAVRERMVLAAREEADHLAWCRARLAQLDARPSVLDPLFYAASYALGAVAGLAGDKVSLGFVEATEDQVCRHLERHLDALPVTDAKSRAILERMREEEARHGAAALDAGGEPFPEPVKRLLTLVSRLMTETTYRV
jgi:ubiquinone biosynthesis monooxygenase Coq7